MIKQLPSSSNNSLAAQSKHVRHKKVSNIIVKHNLIIQKFLIYFLFGLKILLLIALVWTIIIISRPKHTDQVKPITVEIPMGSSITEVTEILKRENVVPNKIKFYWIWLFGKKNIQAGIYLFEPNETAKNVYQKILNGQVNEEKITIIEGWRSEQIAQLLESKNYVKYEAFMQNVSSLEGKLFPDTYRIALNSTADVFIDKLVENYNLKTEDLNLRSDQLIVASLVEREAKFDEDRPPIASVIYNRLKNNMKLQIDATVQYAKDDQQIKGLDLDAIKQFKFWQKISTSDTSSVNSKYNTYQNNGLPPGPICNPGMKSINAAQNPGTSDFYYYITDQDGKAHFAKNRIEHQENINKYL